MRDTVAYIMLLQVDALAARHPHLSKLDDIGEFYRSQSELAKDTVDTKSILKSRSTDISLLSRFIASEEETRDERLPWTWDTLFAATSSEMREEWQAEERERQEMFRGQREYRG